MSESDFVKSACLHCGGHIEYPAAAVGTSIDCPHCGQPIVLTVTTPARRASGLIWALVVVLAAAAIALVVVFHGKGGAGVAAKPPPPSADARSTNFANASPSAAVGTHPGETVTNDFAVSGGKLAPAAGSSLVYVTGVVHNLSDRQRYGVKVTFELFDADTNAVGKATDYASVIDPRAEWHYKAMVMATKAATAKLDSIVEK